MRFKLALLLATFVLVPSRQTPGTERTLKTPRYTIQIASYANPAEARQLVARLAGLGERATTSVVDLTGRGRWTRVLVGTFATVVEARGHAARLLSRGVISQFFIRGALDRQQLPTTSLNEIPRHSGLSRSPTIFGSAPASSLASPARAAGTWLENKRPRAVSSFSSSVARVDQRAAAAAILPLAKTLSLSLAPSVDTRLLPRPDPVGLAFLLIAGNAGHQHAHRKGGLWITGDTIDGLARLRWIAGESSAELVTVERDGQVKLDMRLLSNAAGVGRVPALEGPLAAIDYISSNEGLLLLVQLTQTRHRYRLHFARQAPTRGVAVEVSGGINLDNNFDSRINPNRRLGKKLDNERPPDGFDSLVAINPVARWVNQETNQLVPGGHIAFHEMAEAHAKLEMGLDYLGDATRSGAHQVALEREKRLKAQRPLAGVVVTAGPNRVLRSEEEIRQFFSTLSSAGHNR
jgi:sporulation related protein